MEFIIMNVVLWISKIGFLVQDVEMSVIVNNIVNVNIIGFKCDWVMFQDLFYQIQEVLGVMFDQNNIMLIGL